MNIEILNIFKEFGLIGCIFWGMFVTPNGRNFTNKFFDFLNKFWQPFGKIISSFARRTKTRRKSRK